MPPSFPSFLSGIYALAFWFAGQLVGKRENTFEEVLKVRTALTVAALDIGAIPSLLMAVFVIFSSGSFQHQAGRLLFPGQAAPARFCSPSEHLVTCLHASLHLQVFFSIFLAAMGMAQAQLFFPGTCWVQSWACYCCGQ